MFRPTLLCLADDDAGELRKGRLDTIVNPNCDVLRRGILKAGDVIQAMMIELREHGSERLFDREEIDDEAGRWIDRSF